MGDLAINGVSGYTALLDSRAATVRGTGSLTQSLPALASPDVVVSLGKQTTIPALYDAGGLLRSLLALDRTGRLPSSATPARADSTLDADLETVLGIDSTAGRLGGPDAALATRPAGDLAQALKNVLAAGEPEPGNADLALQDLLARALEGLSGSNAADRSRAAADALPLAGNATANQARGALDAVSARQLEIAATALDLGGGSASTAVRSDSSAEVFNRLFAAQLEEALAAADPTRPRRRRTGVAGTEDLLLSGASQLTDAAAAALPDDTTEGLAEIALAPQITPEIALRQSLLPLPERAERGAVAPGEGAAQEATQSATPAAGRLRVGELTPRQAATETRAAASAATTPAATSPAPSPANALREPRYAELAAAMTMGAAVYRYQASVSVTVPPGEVDPARTVQSIRAVPGLRPVS